MYVRPDEPAAGILPATPPPRQTGYPRSTSTRPSDPSAGSNDCSVPPCMTLARVHHPDGDRVRPEDGAMVASDRVEDQRLSNAHMGVRLVRSEEE